MKLQGSSHPHTVGRVLKDYENVRTPFGLYSGMPFDNSKKSPLPSSLTKKNSVNTENTLLFTKQIIVLTKQTPHYRNSQLNTISISGGPDVDFFIFADADEDADIYFQYLRMLIYLAIESFSHR